MNTRISKFLIFFLSLFLIVTVISQLYFTMQEGYKTETAISYSASDSVSFQGIFVRDETPITYSGGGIVSYPNPDGSKIAKGSAVAVVYGREADLSANRKVEALEKEISALSEAQDPGTTEVAYPEFISKLITQRYKLLAEAIAAGDLVGIREQRAELTTLLNIMQIITGREEDYNERIDYLSSQLDTAKATQNEPMEYITIEDGGYFVSYVDGYENKLNTDSIDSLTVSDIKAVLDGEGKQSINNGIGKVFDSYSWKMVGIIDNSDEIFMSGNKVTLTLASTPGSIPAKIEKITDTDNPEESIVVLSCSYMNSSLVQHRIERVEMKSADYEGIRVPSKAIRFKDGVKGVYTKLGEEVIFKKLDVIYEGGDYVISRKTTDSSYVVLYDDIIIEGVSLNDR